MKTKWMIIPAAILTMGCAREINTTPSFIEGAFTLYATSGENETRTALQQDGRVFWSPSDCINVFYGDNAGKFTSTNTEPSASAEFKGSLGAFVLDGETEFIAAYPYSENVRVSGNQLSLVLPFEQTAVEETFADDLFISVAKSKDNNLHFYNVCGGIAFSLERDDIKKVVFRGNNGESLAGCLTIEIGSDGIPQVTNVTSGRTSVALVAPDNGTFKAGAFYYIVLVPQVLQRGYSMELYTDDLVETISSESSATIRRSRWGELKDLGTPPMAVPEAIDLGLPSGTLWASFNLGASKPEENGYQYAWGETEPRYSSYDPLVWKDAGIYGYSWPVYKWCMGEENTLTKYCTDSSYGYNGFVDGKYILDPDDDAAQVALGGKWRMPTPEEADELIKYCISSYTGTTLNGVSVGKLVGPNGNEIVFPATGFWIWTNLNEAGTNGYYATLGSDFPTALYGFWFGPSSLGCFNLERCYGFSIRPVYADAAVSVESVFIDKSSLVLSVGETATLEATVLPGNLASKAVSWSSSDESVASVSSTGVVTAVAPGAATITVTTVHGGKTAKCNVTVNPVIDPYSAVPPEAIDLGLSVKWASFNLGATKPEEYGDFFAWGETEPYYISLDPLVWKPGKEKGYNTVFETYKWAVKEDSKTYFTKYCLSPEYGYHGFTDGKTLLDPEDDAAHVSLGDKWRMPTLEEQKELLTKCTWEELDWNGVHGCKVTGPNGNSIFLPATGHWYGLTYYAPGENGYYWSMSLKEHPTSGDSAWAYMMLFYPNTIVKESSLRFDGSPIRPVYGDR